MRSRPNKTQPLWLLLPMTIFGCGTEAKQGLIDKAESGSFLTENVVATDDFESRRFDGGTGSWSGAWVTNGRRVRIVGPSNKQLRLKRSGIAERGVTAPIDQTLKLSFEARFSSFEPDDVFRVSLGNPGDPPMVSAELAPPSGYDGSFLSFTLSLANVNDSSGVLIRFENLGDSKNDTVYVDNVMLTSEVSAPPGCGNPSECAVGYPDCLVVDLSQDPTGDFDGTAFEVCVCVIGDERPNEINGTPFDDGICGGDGDDQVDGHEGHDVIEGGDGDDLLSGGNGDDVLEGNEANDTLDGGDGNDRINGGSGFDVLNGGDGDDLLDGSDDEQTDFVDGSAGFDSCHGHAGQDILAGCETVIP